MKIRGLDYPFDPIESQSAIGFEGQGLWLDAAQDSRTATLVAIGVRLLPSDVFIAAPAMGQQGDEVGLCAAGGEQGGFHAQQGRGLFLESGYSGILSIDIVAHLGLRHGLAHGCAGSGHRITAQIDCHAGPRTERRRYPIVTAE